MNLLKKFFSVRSPRKVCVRTYELFLEGITVDQIFSRLCTEGFPERSAARAVTFMPSAFARVHYEKDGIGFPERFYTGRKACKKGRMIFYAEEPMRDGDWSQVWRIIEISAEHRGVAKSRELGLTPERMDIPIYEF